jgi:hypothetical protein
MSSEAIIAVVGILATLIGAVGTTFISNRSAAERGGRQWIRQLEEQRRDELLKACENYIVVTASALDANSGVPLADVWSARVRVE